MTRIEPAYCFDRVIRRPLQNRVPRMDEKIDTEKCLGEKLGVVKSFGEYERPGYGHISELDIKDKGECNEYFVHYTNIKGSGFKNLAKGQHVKFKGYQGPKGLYATDVVVVTG